MALEIYHDTWKRRRCVPEGYRETEYTVSADGDEVSSPPPLVKCKSWSATGPDGEEEEAEEEGGGGGE